MKQCYKIADEYCKALLSQHQGEFALNRALNGLGSDNQIVSLAGPITAAYTALVKDLLGESLFDWLEWWMYECDYGTESKAFRIYKQDRWFEYDTKDLSLYEFLGAADV